MPISTLFEQGVNRYVEEERDTPKSLWFFVHIPKTAGTSFRSEIADKLQPDRNIYVEANKHTPHHVALAAATREFIKAMPTRRYRFASGHLPCPLVDLVTSAVPQARLIVMLRDPVARVASSYYYQSSEAHPPHQAFRSRFPRLEDFAVAPDAQNEMYSYLSKTPAESVEELCRRVSATFSFVGLSESYDLSSRLLFALLGGDRGPSRHLNRGESRAATPLSPEIVDEIRRRNSLDAELYEFFASRYAAVVPELEAYLDGAVRV